MRRLIPLVLLVSSCAPPRQVVEVTQRPLRPPSTETTADPESRPADPYEGVEYGRFDGGKMWTFDAPPLEYFRSEYGFEPDSAWFEHARLAALRFASHCSASFVSGSGLVLTNHHCGRESVSEVSREGENLLDNGFVARTLEDERAVKELFVDQLVSIEDVTSLVYGPPAPGQSTVQQAEARERRAEAIGKRMTLEAAARDSALVVEVIPLFMGGRYAAYTFRRFRDVRLVAAPELQLGFFGGDWDNFTYPRFSLDFSLFRVYGRDGRPLAPERWFAVDTTGADPGEPVFVIGNPGSTSRLATVTQLEYERDVELPNQLAVLERRAEVLRDYIRKNPEDAERHDLRNSYFSLSNSIKSIRGQLAGLRSDWLIPRKGAAESALRRRIEASDSLSKSVAGVFGEIEGVDRAKRATAPQAGAFAWFPAPDMSSHVLVRALYAYVYTVLKQRGAPENQLEEIRKEALKLRDRPAAVEEAFLRLRLEELQATLGKNDPTVRRLFEKRAPAELATVVVDSTALVDSTRFAGMMDGSYLSSGDATVELILAIAPLYFTLNQQMQNLGQQEGYLNAKLARARLALFGSSVPPDASFSLRISDGVVSGYRYNGTEAPPFTTYFGLYDREASLGAHPDWQLPGRWLPVPDGFDPSTALNLVSTNDITGGNSGSPLIDRSLRVVGLVFDSNMEALPNEYVYTDTAARTVSVDVRGILEALGAVYGADRLVDELVRGSAAAPEAGAR